MIRFRFRKKTVENEVIQKEIKSLEKDYLKRKAEEIPDYSKELATLREIDGGIKKAGVLFSNKIFS